MSVAIPVLFATNSKSQALKWTILNGLCEPVSVIFCMLLIPAESVLNADGSSPILGAMLAAGKKNLKDLI